MTTPLTFSVTRVIEASSETVWETLGDFGHENRWTRSVANCERNTADVHIGTVRDCKLPKPLMGRTHARETLTEYERGVALAYVLDGSAGPFAKASSRWSTTRTESGATKVTVQGFFEPRNLAVRLLVWPLARIFIRRLTRSVLAELDAFVSARPALANS